MDPFVSEAHLHLLVNHVPIFGALFALVLLAASFLWARDVLRRTALVVLIATAAGAIAANASGEPAEDAVRGLPGIQRDVIHEHEELAEVSYMGAVVLGVIAAGALTRWRRAPLPRGVTLVALVGTTALAGAMAYTGFLGGRIRHTEVRPGATAADAVRIEPSRGRSGEE